MITSAAHPAYLERVYSGVLGKMIGVYLGRPVENWSYERIAEEFGEVDYYVHDRRGRLLIITDDDLSGTFTFLRALEDYGPEATAEQIGQTWLNYLIERTTILWWGGLGVSTEHTAYLRLKNGLKAPASGAIETNTRVVAEQIGAQIFIDGWGLVCPGDPVRAAAYARRAASVSHDGEAIYGAQVVASIVAAAFCEPDIQRLLDTGLAQIPADCTIRRLIDDLRKWHATGEHWRESRARLAAEYPYERFHGLCPIVPNHGLIVLSLLHGDGDFDRSMAIVNTCGWDTDCNSGNVGCILGVRNGLAGFEGKDWRGPVADRLYLPSADGGRAITDAVREAERVANMGRAIAGLKPIAHKGGARFHFSLPGSVQGWQGGCRHQDGALRIRGRASTPTFIPPDTKDLVTGYVLVSNPTLYPGHTVRLALRAGNEATEVRPFLFHYDADDGSAIVQGPGWALGPNETGEFAWTVPDTGGYPIHGIGLESEAEVDLEWMDWEGVPETAWPPAEGSMWGRAWACSLQKWDYRRDAYEWLVQNEGIGLLTQGPREWRDYRFEARLTPKMARSSGLVARCQGMRRYVAFVFGNPGEVRIDKALDGVRTLASAPFDWQPYGNYEVAFEVQGDRLRGFIDGNLVLETVDAQEPLAGGACGFLVEAGCLGAGTPKVAPR